MSGSFVLHGVHVLDERGGFGPPCDVAVADGLITEVDRGLATAGREVVDLTGLWLMPGFVDCHSHITTTTLDGFEAMSMPVTRWALEAARNAEVALEAGVTTLRDASGADAGLRDAGAAGLFDGPDILISCVMLSETGGHGDGFLAGPGLEITPDYYVPDFPGRVEHLVDGAEGMRAAVRAVLRAGADWIKVAATGGAGVLAPDEWPDRPELSFEEIAVAVEEGRRKNVPVMAHAMAGEGIDDSIRAGVRSIEHGWFLTEEQAVAMAEAGSWLVPTHAIGHRMIDWAEAGEFPAEIAARARALRGRLAESLRLARDCGVRIALGSDFITREDHARSLIEIDHVREAGLSPEEALLAGTLGGAELCGRAATHGRIRPGFVFDALILDHDPLDTAVFRRPSTAKAVFKQGRLIRSELPQLGPPDTRRAECRTSR